MEVRSIYQQLSTKVVELGRYLKRAWNSSNELADWVLTFSILALFLTVALFGVSLQKESIDQMTYAVNLHGISFTSKHDDIRQVSSLVETGLFGSDERGLYIQSIDQFFRMQGVQLPVETLDSLYSTSTDIREIYKTLVQGDSWEKGWGNRSFLLDSLQSQKQRWGFLEVVLFGLLMLVQSFAVLFQARRENIKSVKK